MIFPCIAKICEQWKKCERGNTVLSLEDIDFYASGIDMFQCNMFLNIFEVLKSLKADVT